MPPTSSNFQLASHLLKFCCFNQDLASTELFFRGSSGVSFAEMKREPFSFIIHFFSNFFHFFGKLSNPIPIFLGESGGQTRRQAWIMGPADQVVYALLGQNPPGGTRSLNQKPGQTPNQNSQMFGQTGNQKRQMPGRTGSQNPQMSGQTGNQKRQMPGQTGNRNPQMFGQSGNRNPQMSGQSGSQNWQNSGSKKIK